MQIVWGGSVALNVLVEYEKHLKELAEVEQQGNQNDDQKIQPV